jgi:LPXTG-motif cell wall-anchored protein
MIAARRPVRRLAVLAAVAALFVAALTLIGAPSARGAELPVVPEGCVFTGGGVVCGVGSDINEPPVDTEPVDQPVEDAPTEPADAPATPVAEAPAAPAAPAEVVDPAPSDPATAEPAEPAGPVEVTTAPPAPTFTDPCGPDNVEIAFPTDAGPWLYSIHRDEVGGSGFVQASLPDGFVIGGDGPLAGNHDWYPVFEFRDSHAPCATLPPAGVQDAPPAPSAPERAAQLLPATLPETGGESVIWLALVGCTLVAAGAGFMLHRRTHI